jgi:hypothetical protein
MPRFTVRGARDCIPPATLRLVLVFVAVTATPLSGLMTVPLPTTTKICAVG